MKQCEYEGCTQEVDSWQDYCVKHFIEIRNMQKEELEKKKQMSPQRPVENIIPNPPQQQETTKPIVTPLINNPLTEAQRIKLKIKATEYAIDFFKDQSNNKKDFDKAMNKIALISNKFYSIMVREHGNE